MKTRTFGALAAVAALALAGAAEAHPRLLSAVPAANSRGAAPAVIRLNFSESLIPKFCQISLADAAGRKVPVGPSTVTGGKQLSAPVAGKLKPGPYKVTWKAVSTDTHRVGGAFGFTVR